VTEGVEFREASVDDAAEIAALINSCYRGDSSRQGWTTEADLLDGTRTNEAEIESLITTSGSIILTCTDGNEIIGSVYLQKQQPSSCYLGMLVVKPQLQGSGLGRRLMAAAEDHVRKKWGAKQMTMSVITVRNELIEYYQRRGYRRTGLIKPFIIDDVHGIPRVEGIELEILEKDL
jgi:ribosomal protein S18 acetylase RimI-like enzyme